MRWGFLLAACCAMAVAPAVAQQSPAARQQVGAAIAIPFDPPLDRPLLYRQTVDQTRNGRPVSTSLDLRVTFARDGSGYIMTVAYLLPAGMSATHPAMVVLMRPISLRLNDRGAIVGMVDEAGYWAALDTIVDGLARHEGGNDPSAARMMRELMASMRNLPDESRLALITRNFSPIIEYSGAEMRLDEVLEGSVESAGPFGPVVQDVRTSLTGASASEARIEATYRLAPGQLESMIRTLQTRFRRAPDAREQQTLGELDIERRDSFRISLTSGLTEQHESVVTLRGQIGGQAGAALKRQRLVRQR